MSRIQQAFERAAQEKRAALITYLCAGDPSLEKTPALILALADAGADIVEVGVPFSDPTADGPTIQQASERALKAGTTMRGTLDAIAEVRKTSQVPIVLFGYYNPVLAMGEENFVRAAKQAGVDGVLLVDLPLEEAGGLHALLRAQGLDYVPLVAPTSTSDRIEHANRLASSFVYYVSLTGVTGSATLNAQDVATHYAALKSQIQPHVGVGFGVKTPDDVAKLARFADGVVVGSAIVEKIALNPAAPDKAVSSFVGGLRSACTRL